MQNNPLSFTDPTGHFLSGLFKAIGHFFSSIFRAIEHAIKAVLSSSIFRAVLQIAACAFGTPIGCMAAAGGLSLAAGGTPLQAFEAMAFAGVSMAVWYNVGNVLQGASSLAKVLVHGVVNGALRMAQGGSFLNGFAVGAAGEGAEVGMREAGLYSVAGDEGKFIRASIAGAAGGTASVLTGGKFANGAVSAAFAHLFNDEDPAHRRNKETYWDSERHPALEELAKNPIVSAAIDKAWADLNSYATDAADRQERGFFITRDESGNIGIKWFPTQGAKNDTMFPGEVPPDAIATFHTHPNADLSPLMSPGDFEWMKGHNYLPGIIQSHQGMTYSGYSWALRYYGLKELPK